LLLLVVALQAHLCLQDTRAAAAWYPARQCNESVKHRRIISSSCTDIHAAVSRCPIAADTSDSPLTQPSASSTHTTDAVDMIMAIEL
jgi:hypothetical protein